MTKRSTDNSQDITIAPALDNAHLSNVCFGSKADSQIYTLHHRLSLSADLYLE